jgi:hypothetical protein
MTHQDAYRAVGHESATFNDLLIEQLKSAPWLLISLSIHVLIAIVLHFISAGGMTSVLIQPIEVQAAEAVQEEIPLPVVQDDVNEVKPTDQVSEEPVVKDTEVADHNETDNDEDTEQSKGEEDALSDKPFDLSQSGDTMGLGGGGGGPFGTRIGGSKNLKSGPGSGGSPITVKQGLDWLSAHQSPDGRWDCDGFMANGDAAKGPLCDGKGMATYDVGVTGLALLCFLGAGHTTKVGDYQDTVREGLKWLKSMQDSDGCFGPRGDPHHTYSHGIAALAMAEAFGMTQSGIWKTSAQSGINYVMHSQNPYKAWRYGARPGDNDISVTGWMVMALKSAKMAGLDINDNSLAWALDFTKEMTDEETGRTGYMKRGERPVRAEGRVERWPAEESESLTGVGIINRVFAGEDPATSPAIKAGAELISRRLPVWDPKGGKVDMYYWYYATLAMFQVGGPQWNAWNSKLESAVIKTQRSDGNFAGSWDPVDPWGEDGGRVYSTALMTLCMEVYYRYPRVFGAAGR